MNITYSKLVKLKGGSNQFRMNKNQYLKKNKKKDIKLPNFDRNGNYNDDDQDEEIEDQDEKIINEQISNHSINNQNDQNTNRSQNENKLSQSANYNVNIDNWQKHKRKKWEDEKIYQDNVSEIQQSFHEEQQNRTVKDALIKESYENDEYNHYRKESKQSQNSLQQSSFYPQKIRSESVNLPNKKIYKYDNLNKNIENLYSETPRIAQSFYNTKSNLQNSQYSNKNIQSNNNNISIDSVRDNFRINGKQNVNKFNIGTDQPSFQININHEINLKHSLISKILSIDDLESQLLNLVMADQNIKDQIPKELLKFASQKDVKNYLISKIKTLESEKKSPTNIIDEENEKSFKNSVKYNILSDRNKIYSNLFSKNSTPIKKNVQKNKIDSSQLSLFNKEGKHSLQNLPQSEVHKQTNHQLNNERENQIKASDFVKNKVVTGTMQYGLLDKLNKKRNEILLVQGKINKKLFEKLSFIASSVIPEQKLKALRFVRQSPKYSDKNYWKYLSKNIDIFKLQANSQKLNDVDNQDILKFNFKSSVTKHHKPVIKNFHKQFQKLNDIAMENVKFKKSKKTISIDNNDNELVDTGKVQMVIWTNQNHKLLNSRTKTFSNSQTLTASRLDELSNIANEVTNNIEEEQKSESNGVKPQINEAGFNFDDYFKSSDMFMGVPPVFKRLLNNYLVFSSEMEPFDFDTRIEQNICKMLEVTEMVDEKKVDMEPLQGRLGEIVDEERELNKFKNHVDDSIFHTTKEPELSEYNTGQGKDVRKFLKQDRTQKAQVQTRMIQEQSDRLQLQRQLKLVPSLWDGRPSSPRDFTSDLLIEEETEVEVDKFANLEIESQDSVVRMMRENTQRQIKLAEEEARLAEEKVITIEPLFKGGKTDVQVYIQTFVSPDNHVRQRDQPLQRVSTYNHKFNSNTIKQRSRPAKSFVYGFQQIEEQREEKVHVNHDDEPEGMKEFIDQGLPIKFGKRQVYQRFGTHQPNEPLVIWDSIPLRNRFLTEDMFKITQMLPHLNQRDHMQNKQQVDYLDANLGQVELDECQPFCPNKCLQDLVLRVNTNRLKMYFDENNLVVNVESTAIIEEHSDASESVTSLSDYFKSDLLQYLKTTNMNVEKFIQYAKKYLEIDITKELNVNDIIKHDEFIEEIYSVNQESNTQDLKDFDNKLKERESQKQDAKMNKKMQDMQNQDDHIESETDYQKEKDNKKNTLKQTNKVSFRKSNNELLPELNNDNQKSINNNNNNLQSKSAKNLKASKKKDHEKSLKKSKSELFKKKPDQIIKKIPVQFNKILVTSRNKNSDHNPDQTSELIYNDQNSEQLKLKDLKRCEVLIDDQMQFISINNDLDTHFEQNLQKTIVTPLTADKNIHPERQTLNQSFAGIMESVSSKVFADFAEGVLDSQRYHQEFIEFPLHVNLYDRSRDQSLLWQAIWTLKQYEGKFDLLDVRKISKIKDILQTNEFIQFSKELGLFEDEARKHEYQQAKDLIEEFLKIYD